MHLHRFIKGNHCKHLIYVYLIFLKVPEISHVWYQRGLTRRELFAMFRNAPNKQHNAPPLILSAYYWSYHVEDGNASKPDPEDVCAFCMELPDGVDKSELTYCACCGKACHKTCFSGWVESARQSSRARLPWNKYRNLTCPSCRRRWFGPEALIAHVKFKTTKEGYIHLGRVLNIRHPKLSRSQIVKRKLKYRRNWMLMKYHVGHAPGPDAKMARPYQYEKFVIAKDKAEQERSEKIARAKSEERGGEGGRAEHAAASGASREGEEPEARLQCGARDGVQEAAAGARAAPGGDVGCIAA